MTTVRTVARSQAAAVTSVSPRRKHRINVDADGLSFGDRLRMAREESGLSQVSVAESSGFGSHSLVSDLERETKKGAIEARTVELLARVLGTTMDWLWIGARS